MSANAAAVSRLLAKRFTRSVSLSGRVRGYRSSTRGFTVRQSGQAVTVGYETGTVGRRGEDAEILSRLTRIAEYLRAEGYAAEVVAPNGERAAHRVVRVSR